VRAIRKYMNMILLLSNLCSTAARGGVFGAADLKKDAPQADPISGLYWIRVADPVRPSAPPRLVRLSGFRRSHPAATKGPICVRAGDHIRLDGVDFRKSDIDRRGEYPASALPRVRNESEDEFADHALMRGRRCGTHVQIAAEQLAAKTVVPRSLHAVIGQNRARDHEQFFSRCGSRPRPERCGPCVDPSAAM